MKGGVQFDAGREGATWRRRRRRRERRDSGRGWARAHGHPRGRRLPYGRQRFDGKGRRLVRRRRHPRCAPGRGGRLRPDPEESQKGRTRVPMIAGTSRRAARATRGHGDDDSNGDRRNHGTGRQKGGPRAKSLRPRHLARTRGSSKGSAMTGVAPVRTVTAAAARFESLPTPAPCTAGSAGGITVFSSSSSSSSSEPGIGESNIARYASASAICIALASAPTDSPC